MGKHSDIQPMFPHLTGLWFFLGSCPICPVIYGQMLLAVSINHLPFEPLRRFNPFLITTLRRHADFDSTLEARQEPIVSFSALSVRAREEQCQLSSGQQSNELASSPVANCCSRTMGSSPWNNGAPPPESSPVDHHVSSDSPSEP